jgi:dynein heavy chain, axonemal
MGYTVIFEDANESFDPILEPILMKQLKKEGNEIMIKFGDKVLSYSMDFKFFITTKIARPHYSPETCVKVTMINFMVTPEGLLDQITSVILKLEEAKKYEAREKCITQKAESDRIVKQL